MSWLAVLSLDVFNWQKQRHVPSPWIAIIPCHFAKNSLNIHDFLRTCLPSACGPRRLPPAVPPSLRSLRARSRCRISRGSWRRNDLPRYWRSTPMATSGTRAGDTSGLKMMSKVGCLEVHGRLMGVYGFMDLNAATINSWKRVAHWGMVIPVGRN